MCEVSLVQYNTAYDMNIVQSYDMNIVQYNTAYNMNIVLYNTAYDMNIVQYNAAYNTPGLSCAKLSTA